VRVLLAPLRQPLRREAQADVPELAAPTDDTSGADEAEGRTCQAEPATQGEEEGETQMKRKLIIAVLALDVGTDLAFYGYIAWRYLWT
jgi:hypothetical protein